MLRALALALSVAAALSLAIAGAAATPRGGQPLAGGELVGALRDGGYVIGALAWAFHVALDRTVGYGLRTSDGFRRV